MPETLTQEVPAIQPDWEATVQTIHELGIAEDVSARADQIAQIDGPGLMTVATTLHEQLVPGVSHEPTDYPMKLHDKQGTVTKTFVNPSERPAIYDHAADLIRSLAERRTPDSDQAFLNRAANVANLALVLAHPFKDGNGRTSRVMGQLIREGFSGDQQSHDDLRFAGEGRDDKSGVKPLATRPIRDGQTLDESQLLSVAASMDIPLEDAAAYVSRKQNHFDNTWSD